MKNTKLLHFNTPQDMLQHIVNNNDLYNIKTGEYVFLYNDQNAIAVYQLTKEQADNLYNNTHTSNEPYWSSHLGPGGAIYDEPDNLHWCTNSYASEFWINTTDYKPNQTLKGDSK